MTKMMAALSGTGNSVVVQEAADMASVNEARKMQGLQPFTEPQDTLKFASMKIGELRALAKERGLDSTGTRDDLLARLQA
jgi:N12 class adenine-specific DNA methylase